MGASGDPRATVVVSLLGQSQVNEDAELSRSDDRNGGDAGLTTLTALLFATVPAVDGGPAATLEVHGTTVLGRLLGQLESLGVARAWVVTRPNWRATVERAAAGSRADVTVLVVEDLAGDFRAAAQVADNGGGPLVVSGAHVLTQHSALTGLLADPRIASGILAASSPVRDQAATPVLALERRVLSAGSQYHRVIRPTGYFLGLLKLDAGDRKHVVALSQRLARLAAERQPSQAAPQGGSTDAAVALLLVGLVRSDVELFAEDVGAFVYAAPLSADTAEEAVREMTEHDEDRAQLESAVKANDSFFTTFLVSPYSKHLARFAARRGWSPDAVTAASFGIGLLAAASFAVGSRAGLIVGAVLLQASFTIDCVDGQLARYTRTFSKLGGWLDSVFDRTKEYLVYAGLAIGATRGFGDDVWTLAAAALALQTVRHMLDASYTAFQQDTAASVPALPLEQPDDDLLASALQFPGGASEAIHGRTRRSTWTLWAHRFLRLPIGERFALISLTAAIANPRVTFIALLAWGGLAAVYAVAGRLLAAYSSTARVVRAALR